MFVSAKHPADVISFLTCFVFRVQPEAKPSRGHPSPGGDSFVGLNPIPSPHPSFHHTNTTTMTTLASQDPILAPLLNRNQEWATKKADPGLLKACGAGQAPKVLWIGCADSRCPEAVVTESQPGEVFVHVSSIYLSSSCE